MCKSSFTGTIAAIRCHWAELARLILAAAIAPAATCRVWLTIRRLRRTRWIPRIHVSCLHWFIFFFFFLLFNFSFFLFIFFFRLYSISTLFFLFFFFQFKFLCTLTFMNSYFVMFIY